MSTAPRSAGRRGRAIGLLRAGVVWVAAAALVLLVSALVQRAVGGSWWPAEEAWWVVVGAVMLLAVVMAATTRGLHRFQRGRAERDDEVGLCRPGRRWRSGKLQLADGRLGFRAYRGGTRLAVADVEDLGPVLGAADQPRPLARGERLRFPGGMTVRRVRTGTGDVEVAAFTSTWQRLAAAAPGQDGYAAQDGWTIRDRRRVAEARPPPA